MHVKTFNYSNFQISSHPNEVNFSVWIVNLVLMFVGMIGNILSVYAFYKKKMRMRNFNWYLLLVAIFELYYCLILFTDYLLKLIFTQNYYFNEFSAIISMAIDSTQAVDTFVILITLILAIDRYITIKNPKKKKFFITNLHPKYITFSVIFVISLLKLPSLFIICCHHSLSNAFFYFSIINIFLNVISIILILVFNSLLIKEIIIYYKNQRNEWLRELNSRSQSNCNVQIKYKKNKLIRTNRLRSGIMSRTHKAYYFVIILLGLWLILTGIPYYTLNFIFLNYNSNQNVTAIENIMKERKTLHKIQNIASTFFNSNHCINFFVYMCFDGLFRGCFLKFFKTSRKFYF